MHIFYWLVDSTIFCLFFAPKAQWSLFSPQLPCSGEGWTGEPAVPGGRKSHRLVKRGKNHGFLSLLQLQRMQGGECLSWVSILFPNWNVAQDWVHKSCFRSRLAVQPLPWFVSSAQPRRAWRESMVWYGHSWQPAVGFGVLAEFPTLILLVCDVPSL